MLDYLGVDVTSVYVRGEREGDGPVQWYVQLTFPAVPAWRRSR